MMGLFGVSISPFAFGNGIEIVDTPRAIFAKPHLRYPALIDEQVSEVVGASHFDLDKVKALVDKRPELARASWDWGFGDFESALGAASHVGRRDIVQYLLSQGARPNIFTYAMMGAYDVVKGMIEFAPGVQRNLGPHGLSLLSHAKAGQRMQDTMSKVNVESLKKLTDYLESLGDADGTEYEDETEAAKQKYLGDYKYGEGADEGFTVRLNMRKLLSLGKIGNFGGALFKIGDNKFFYNSAPSTVITFQIENNNVKSLTVSEPDSVMVAAKI